MSAPQASRDGDGWVRCQLGHAHWGLYGAAGLLLVCDGRILMQHRAFWSHHGNTWGIPGGAQMSSETAQQAAKREAQEETGLTEDLVTVIREIEDVHGGWTYTTVVAQTPVALALTPLDGESTALEWVPVEEVTDLPLHPGFAASWPAHRQALRSG